MSALPQWGREVGPEQIGGASFSMYTERPRRLGELLGMAPRWGDRAHIVQGSKVVTFDDLAAHVAQRGQELVDAGVTPGSRVVILGFNSAAWIVNFWATVSIGGVAVLGNAWWSEDELQLALERTEPVLVLAQDRVAGRVPERWTLGAWELGSLLVDRPAAIEDRGDENDAAAIIFTSGTSGTPKAAVLSHRALLAGLQMLLDITRRLPHEVDRTKGEAALHTGPMFHVGGIQTLLRAICVGDTLVMPVGRFEPAETIELIEAWGIRRWSAVPTMVNRVLAHPDVKTRDLTTLRSLTVGGAPIHPEFLARIRDGIPGVEPRIATGYGLTENGGQAVAASGADTVKRPGTTGRPLPCVEVRIGPSSTDADGEILLRSPTQMSGYLGNVESPIDADGWLHTGDLGRLDDDGYLWITGRSKDMIIRGGENIAPAAVEAALIKLPAIEDAVVFGIPHADLGEEIVAVVVAPEGLDTDKVARDLRGTLATFAIPSRWVVQSESFPETHSGKVDKNAVVAAHSAAVVAS